MKSNSFMRNRKAFTTVLLFCIGFIASPLGCVRSPNKVMAVQIHINNKIIKGIVVDASKVSFCDWCECCCRRYYNGNNY